jgi:hypothetical protein
MIIPKRCCKSLQITLNVAFSSFMGQFTDVFIACFVYIAGTILIRRIVEKKGRAEQNLPGNKPHGAPDDESKFLISTGTADDLYELKIALIVGI